MLQVNISPSIREIHALPKSLRSEKDRGDFRRPHHQLFITLCDAQQLSTLSYIVNEGVELSNPLISDDRWLQSHASRVVDGKVFRHFLFPTIKKLQTFCVWCLLAALNTSLDYRTHYLITSLSLLAFFPRSCCPWQPGVWSGRVRVRKFTHTHTSTHQETHTHIEAHRLRMNIQFKIHTFINSSDEPMKTILKL